MPKIYLLKDYAGSACTLNKNENTKSGTVALLMKPPIENLTLLRTFSSNWNKFEKNMDIVWDIGMKWIIEAEVDDSPRAFVNRLKTQVDGDDTLTMDRQERLVNLLTLLQAGVDTTSNSLVWTMIQLARRPRIQRRLRRELEETMDGDFSRTEDLPNLPYLKAFLREVQRFSPSAGGNMRRLPFDVTVPSTNPNGDNDKKQEDYVVKKNTLIIFTQEVYSYDPVLLGGDPDEFLPERWLAAEHVLANAKSDKSMDLDPRTPLEVDLASIDFDFGDELATVEHESSSSAVTMNTGIIIAPAPILSSLLLSSPFSVGPRMCVGARVAQNEIYAFLIRIILDYELVLDPPDQPKTERVVKLLQTPFPIPKIRFDPVNP